MTEKTLQKSKWIFVTGAILVVFFSAVIGFMHIGVLYLFGIPIVGLLVGIILVWLGRANAKTKAFFSFISIPLIIATFFSSYYLNKAEAETFLIPNNYRGEIVVFYDEPCGEEPLIEKGRRIYHLSTEGVLITKFKKNRGYLDRKFYLTTDDGDWTEIPLFGRQDFQTEKEEWTNLQSMPVEELTKDTVGVFHTYGGDTYGLSRNSLGNRITNYRYFDREQKELWIEAQQFTEIAANRLKECREK